MNLGSGKNGQLSFIDMIGLLSFFIGLENYGMNLTQNDKADLQKDLSDKSDLLLKEIHQHLEKQDNKIDEILQRLDVSRHGN